MGLQHSTPVPTDQDFSVRHHPLKKPLYTTRQLPPLEYSFSVPKKAWSQGVSLDIVGLTVVPVKGNNKQCIIKDTQTGTVLAVLQVQRYQHIQICTLANESASGRRVVGEYDGKLLLEYATVTENQHIARHFLSVEGGPCYKMAKCGSKFFGPEDAVIHYAQDTSGSPKKKMVCAAYLTEEPRKMWGCRVAPGIDPVIVLAFVLCSDKLQVMFNELLVQKSGIMSYKVKNVLGP
ncbi:expressed unknown protein [Seminavis robusta]|uniref:Uncharacterized protein n=1 Tax=Seminavis robusta TaxID=568900 RepID=A0A9N8D830_9STRA|nr:expressed unknown protein [Seminavis robusta]|eukprot:Sro12_g009100.1 n/a (234) ;mRNA; f:17069-17770